MQRSLKRYSSRQNMQTFGLMKLNIFSMGMILAAGFGALSRALWKAAVWDWRRCAQSNWQVWDDCGAAVRGHLSQSLLRRINCDESSMLDSLDCSITPRISQSLNVARQNWQWRHYFSISASPDMDYGVTWPVHFKWKFCITHWRRRGHILYSFFFQQIASLKATTACLVQLRGGCREARYCQYYGFCALSCSMETPPNPNCTVSKC